MKLIIEGKTITRVYTKGSKFVVVLDQDIVDEKELGTFTLASRARVREGEVYQRSFEAPDAHILVVDDNACRLLQDVQLCPTEKFSHASGNTCHLKQT